MDNVIDHVLVLRILIAETVVKLKLIFGKYLGLQPVVMVIVSHF